MSQKKENKSKTNESSLTKAANASTDAKKKKPEKKAGSGDASTVSAARKKHGRKIAKHTTMATVLTVIFIAAVVLINIVASIVFERYPLTIDLTENSKYSISDETIDYLKSIDSEITVTVLAEENSFSAISEYTVQAMELLKRYQQYNPKISVNYVDLLKNPEIASRYTDVDLNDNDIIFETVNTAAGDDSESFKRIKVVTLDGLVSWSADFTSQVEQYYNTTVENFCKYYGAVNVMNYYGGYIVGSNAEAAFTSAIMTITDPNPIKVTVLTGHKEVSDLSYFQKMLSANGYELSETNIISGTIPEDTDLVIIPAPAEDYLDDDIGKLYDFLQNGGKLEKDALYIASVQQGDTPNLDEFLEEYGVRVEKALVLEKDLDRYYSGAPYLTNPYIVSENYLQDMTTESYNLYMPTARPITLLLEEENMKVTEAFAQSSSAAVSCSYDELGFDADDILSKGIQITIATGSKAAFDNDKTYYSNLLVVGSESFLDDTVLQTAQFQNSEYIISLLNGITGKTNTGIVIATKTITGATFDITEAQAKILKWIFQAAVPLAVLLTGLIVYRRRKNK